MNTPKSCISSSMYPSIQGDIIQPDTTIDCSSSSSFPHTTTTCAPRSCSPPVNVPNVKNQTLMTAPKSLSSEELPSITSSHGMPSCSADNNRLDPMLLISLVETLQMQLEETNRWKASVDEQIQWMDMKMSTILNYVKNRVDSLGQHGSMSLTTNQLESAVVVVNEMPFRSNSLQWHERTNLNEHQQGRSSQITNPETDHSLNLNDVVHRWDDEEHDLEELTKHINQPTIDSDFENDVQLICELGFPEESARHALKSFGDRGLAMSYLLENQSC
nr:unnamed protein product [Naegleria fowleri]